MNRLLFAIGLIVIAVGGLGYYLGWFDIGSERSDGKGRITLSVDEDKFKADEKKAKEKIQDLGDRAKDAIDPPTGKSRK